MRDTRTSSHNGPPQGRGHYDYGGHRWWDGDLGAWLPLTGESDSLSVVVEEIGHQSWPRRVLSAMSGAKGTSVYRFVGVATSRDGRWPSYRVIGTSFLMPANQDLDDLPHQGFYGDLVDEHLTELRAELLKRGWEPEGADGHWWAQKFSRPCLQWPDDLGVITEQGRPSTS